MSEDRLHHESVGWTAEFVTAANSSGDRRFPGEEAAAAAAAAAVAAEGDR